MATKDFILDLSLSCRIQVLRNTAPIQKSPVLYILCFVFDNKGKGIVSMQLKVCLLYVGATLGLFIGIVVDGFILKTIRCLLKRNYPGLLFKLRQHYRVIS